MKHFILLSILLLGTYFGWRYLPNRQRFFVGQFLKEHLLWVALTLGLLVAMLYLMANTTIKLF